MLRTNNNNNNNDDDDNHHHRSLRRGALLGLGFWGLAECAARADQVQVLESRRQRLQDAVQPGGVHGSVLRSRGPARLYDSLRVGRRPLRPPLTYWWQDLVAAVQHTHAAHNTQHTTHNTQRIGYKASLMSVPRSWFQVPAFRGARARARTPRPKKHAPSIPILETFFF